MLVIELAVSANTRGVFFGAAVGSAGSLAPPQALCGPDQPGIKLNYTRSGARCQFGLGIWSLTSEILVRRTRLSHATNDTKVPAQWGRAEEVTVRRCRRNTAAPLTHQAPPPNQPAAADCRPGRSSRPLSDRKGRPLDAYHAYPYKRPQASSPSFRARQALPGMPSASEQTKGRSASDASALYFQLLEEDSNLQPCG